MLDDKAAGGRAAADAEGPREASDFSTKPARSGAAAHQRRVHELAAEERRRADEAADRLPGEPAEPGGDA